MLNAVLAGLLLIQAAPTTPPPAAPAPATPTPVEDIRFCIAATETAAAMMRAQGGDTAMQAAFLEGVVPALQRERAGLGDTDEAALEAERVRVRGLLANGPDAAPSERERFMNTCVPRLRAAMGG
jgi:hypothetical protein